MAIRVDDSADRLEIGTNITGTAVTFGGWFYWDAHRNDWSYPVGFDTDGVNWLLIGTNQSNQLELSTTSGVGPTSGAVPTTGTWYYVAGVVPSTGTNASTLYYAAYGAESLTAVSGTCQLPSNLDFNVGSDSVAEWINGRLAYIRVWTAALSQSELDAERQSATAVRTSNLWGDWPLVSDYDDDSGNGRNLTASGTLSFVSGPSLGPTAPAQVTGLNVVQSALNTAALSWSAPSNGGSAITDYLIERAPDAAGSPGTWGTISDGTSTSTSYSDTTATSPATYWYRVSAINAIGTGPASTAVSVVMASPPSAPGVPIITSAWNGKIHSYLTSAPANNGAPITDYLWQYSTDNSNWSLATDGTGSGLEANIPGLVNGTGYYLRVAAVNSAGASSYGSSAGPVTPVDSGDSLKLGSSTYVRLDEASKLNIRSRLLFPTSVSSSNRYLLDQNGAPIFMIGDTVWSIVGSLTNAQIDQYLNDRVTRGVNYLIASVPEPYYVQNPPNNVDGVAPFTGTPFQSTLNSTYWARVVYFVEGAQRRGISVLLCPFYLGYVDSTSGSDADALDGWGAEIAATSDAQMRTYAGYIHTLLGSYPNVTWLIGHDRIPGTVLRARSSAFIDELRNVLGNTQLLTYGGVHYQDINGTDTFGYGSADWTTVATTHTPNFDTQYDYSEWVVVNAYTMWSKSPTYAFIGFEFKYEQEQSVSNLVLLRQLYGPPNAGACGIFIGINPIWNFENNELFGYSGTWQSNMSSTLSRWLNVFTKLVRILGPEWLTTSADTSSTFITNQGTNGDRIAARFGPNMGTAFHPNMTGSMTVDLTEFSARWSTMLIRRFDPTTGAITTIDAAASTANSAYSVASQGNNAAGNPSWQFIITGAT